MTPVHPTKIVNLCADGLEGRRPIDRHLLRLIQVECIDWFAAEQRRREAVAKCAARVGEIE